MFWLNPDDRARVQACQTRLAAMDASWTLRGGTTMKPATQRVIARADFVAAYFEQTGGEYLWDDWVRIELLGDLKEAHRDPEHGWATMAGWVEVLGCERLKRLMAELTENDPTAMFPDPSHADALMDCLNSGMVQPHQALCRQALKTHGEALADGI